MSNMDKQNQTRGLGRGLESLFGSDLAKDNVEGLTKDTQNTTTQKLTTHDAEIHPSPSINIEEKSEVAVAAPAEPQIIYRDVIKEVIKEVPAEIDEENRIWQIPVEKLRTNNFQPRKVFDKDKISELAASIKEQGVLQPIVARKTISGDFEIIAGERRWRASQQAGLQVVPVILKDVDDQKSLELALIENIQRENLNPLEEAEAYEQLAREFNLTQQQISEKVGKDRATVANSLRLLTLAPEVKAMLSAGEISAGHAKALLAIQDPIKQREVAKKIASEKLTVRAAEKLVKHATKVKSEAIRDETMESLMEIMADDLQKTLGTKVKIDYTDGAGKITIHFYSDTELTQVTDRIKGTWKPSSEQTL